MNVMHKYEMPTVPVANLVDIAILLIIFFMACSHFVTSSSVQLKPPRAENLKSLNEALVVVSVDASGKIFMQGQPVPSADMVETGVAELLKDKVTEEGRTVMFKCDAAVNRDVYEPLLEAIAKGGGLIAAVGEKVKSRSSDRERDEEL